MGEFSERDGVGCTCVTLSRKRTVVCIFMLWVRKITILSSSQGTFIGFLHFDYLHYSIFIIWNRTLFFFSNSKVQKCQGSLTWQHLLWGPREGCGSRGPTVVLPGSEGNMATVALVDDVLWPLLWEECQKRVWGRGLTMTWFYSLWLLYGVSAKWAETVAGRPVMGPQQQSRYRW